MDDSVAVEIGQHLLAWQIPTIVRFSWALCHLGNMHLAQAVARDEASALSVIVTPL